MRQGWTRRTNRSRYSPPVPATAYPDAWSRPDGTYILSNDPMFDPTVVFQENWQKLEKGR